MEEIKQGIIQSFTRFKEGNGGSIIKEEYELGAKAENVYIENPDGTTNDVQTVLFDLTPPQTYNLILETESEEDFVKPIKWSQITQWLQDGSINKNLKPGDCLVVRTTTTANNTSIKIPLFVIGVNNHNGQLVADKNKSHIDFMIPGLSKILHYINGERQESLSEDSPYGAESIMNYRNDGSFFGLDIYENLQETNYSDIINERILHLYQGLNYNYSSFLTKKQLILDGRTSIEESAKAFWGEIYWETIKENLVACHQYIEENDITNIEQIQDATIVEKINYLINSLRNAQALRIARYTIKLSTPAWLYLNKVKNVNLIKSPLLSGTKLALIIQRQALSLTISNDDLSVLNSFVLDACKAYVIEDEISSFYKWEAKYWGLTEYEIFGSAIFGNKYYSKGQVFQYPAFKTLSFRQKIVTSQLDSNTENLKKPFVTITQSDNSNYTLIGYDVYKDNDNALIESNEPLIAKEFPLANIDFVQGDNNDIEIEIGPDINLKYEAPFCFRLQAYDIITTE